MRKDFGKKDWFYPLPVLIIASYDEDGNANAMNAAWGGIYDYGKIIISLSAGHKTTKNILNKRAFTVSFADKANVVASDYVGIVSANKEPNKLEKAGFHTTRSTFVDAPLIDELPVAIECKLIKVTEDGNIIGEVVNVSVDSSVLDENEKISPDKFLPISFDAANNTYRVLGAVVENAFKAGEKLK